jgi:hypothetical protein
MNSNRQTVKEGFRREFAKEWQLRMKIDDETIALRVAVIAGQPYADDYTVIWRGLSIGRIMKSSGVPAHVPQSKRSSRRLL